MNPQDKRWQIHRHLAQDTDERLQIVRNAPKRILLVGADADISRSLLAARYPNAVFEEYDPRADFLQTASAARKSGFWQKLTGKTVPQHCQALTDPLPEASADMLWAFAQFFRTGRISSARGRLRFAHNISAQASGSVAVRAWQCCGTVLPVSFCQNPLLRAAAAVWRKSARGSYSSNTAFG